ncbi:MAG TPA: DUF1697 domain-containing protein [Luteitalea sp.]|nr:DUF1697 domain-containing protein [Luteitalea sp.]
MSRYVAFLRGVSPSNASMPALVAAFERAGFANVRSILSSGNVAFDSRRASNTTLAAKAEEGMREELGRSFPVIVRSTDDLRTLLASAPFDGHLIPTGAKRVVTFLGSTAAPRMPLPVSLDGATVLGVVGREAFTYYERSSKGAVFMRLIEKALGTDVTTRTWESVERCSTS